MALFYALSGYTKAAIEYAEIADVALFQYDVAGNVAPVSTAAKVLQERAGDPTSFDVADFERQVAGQRFGQQAFDQATSAFPEVARQALAIGERDRRSPAFATMKVELREVKARIETIHTRGTMPLSEILAEVAGIEAATERLRGYVSAGR